jgi:hypothetical protein
MNAPTHDAISLHAWQLWRNRGKPAGCDRDIWLEAERELYETPAASPVAAAALANADEESEDPYHLSPALTEQESILAAIQREVARDPQTPRHTGPTSKPAETGKPLWSQPHSA